jgi:hypothetical protein
MIDLFDSSVADVCEALVGAAWDGQHPDMNFGLPSSHALSRCDSQHSAVHFEILDDPTPDHLKISDIPFMAPLSRYEEPVPSDTTSPFKYPNGEAAVGGLFGRALKKYGEVMAIMASEEVDGTGYDEFFREQWNLTADDDLNAAIPQTRSSGAAMWGGVTAKLVPAIDSNIATSSLVRVKWHSKSRTDYGNTALVPWPQLTQVVMHIATTLAVDDRLVKGRVKRLDFAISHREVPKAPKFKTNYMFPAGKFKSGTGNPATKYAIEYFKSNAEKAVALRSKGIGDVVQISEKFEIDRAAIIKAFEKRAAPAVSWPSFAKEERFEQDLLADFMVKREYSDLDPKLAKTSNFRARLENLMHGYIVRSHRPEFNPGYFLALRAELDDESFDKSEKARLRLRAVIRDAVPRTFLETYRKILTGLTGDKAEVWGNIVDIVKQSNLSSDAFSKMDLVYIWAALLSDTKGLKFVCDRVKNIIFAERASHAYGYPAIKSFVRLLGQTQDVNLVLGSFIKKRLAYWSSDYWRRSKNPAQAARRVEFQLRAKLMRGMTIKISDFGAVIPQVDTRAMVSRLHDSVSKYLRKKRKYRKLEKLPDWVNPVANDLSNYARQLDRNLKPKVPYADIVAKVKDSGQLLSDDLKKLLRVFIDRKVDSISEFVSKMEGFDEEKEDQNPVDVEDLDVSDSEEEVEDLAVEKVVIAHVASFEESDEEGDEIKVEGVGKQVEFSVFDESSDEEEEKKVVEAHFDESDTDDKSVDEKENNVAMIDLGCELREEFPGVPQQHVNRFCFGKPAHIPHSSFEAIKTQFLAWVVDQGRMVDRYDSDVDGRDI